MLYFESRSQVYSNGKPRLFEVFQESDDKFQIVPLIPYKRIGKGGVHYGLESKAVAEVNVKFLNEELLHKYYKELTQLEFFEKEITHIPIK